MQPTDRSFDDNMQATRAADLNLVVVCVLGSLSVCLWLGVAWQLLFYVPQSARLFDEFKLKLPLMADTVIAHFWWITPALILVTLAICLASRSKIAWAILLFALPILLNMVVFYSMHLPTQALLEALNR
jgi:hypothetical protein